MPITHSNAASQATPKMVMDEIHNNDAVSNERKEGRSAEDAKSSLLTALDEAFSTATSHSTKDSLSEALDAIVEDADNGKEQEPKANEKDPVVDEDSPVSEDKENKDADKDAPSAPKLADEPDEDGLVYVSMTFKIDPTKYRSANYKPLSTLSKDAAKIGKNNPNAVNKDDEPTPSEEEIAAEEADAKSEDLLEIKDNTKKADREANDSALDDEVVSSPAKDSYPCALPECGFNGGKQDLSKTAMDVRPRPTRQTCQTTFAQCRAENPLFCRFHGPKLLEADIRGTMRALGIRGQVLVTKVPNTDNTFKVTVGCRPSDKEQAKSALRWYSEQMGVTGITNTSDINDIGANGGIGREFQMDLLRADRAPSRSGKEAVANLARNRAVEAGRTMPVVGEEQPARQRRPRREQAAAQPEPQPQQEPVQEQPAPQPEQQQSVEQAAETSHQQPQQPQTTPRQGQPQQGEGDNNQQGQIEHYEGGVKARFSPSERQAIEREMGRAMRASSENPDDAEARSYAHALSHLLGSRDSSVGRRNNSLSGIRDNITKAELLEKAERRLQTTAGDADRYNGSLRAIQKIAELSGIDNLRVSGDRMRLSIGDGDGETRTMSIDEAFHRPLPNQGRPTEIRGEEQQADGGGDAQRRQEANEQEHQETQQNRPQGNGQADIRPPTADERAETLAFLRRITNSGRVIRALARLQAGQAFDPAEIGGLRESDILAVLPQDNSVRRYIENTTPEYRRAVAEAARDEVEGYEPLPQGYEETPQSAAPANNPPRMPTYAEMDSVAAELADRRGWPLSAVRGTIEGIVRGDVPADDYRNEILTIPNDNPVRQYIDHMAAVARAQSEEAERQSQEETDSNQAREISDISSEEALRRVVPARREATREEVISAREANRLYWADGGMHAPERREAIEGAIAANTSGLSQEVFDADHAVQREVMPNCRTFRNGHAYEGEVFASQIGGHGCNCWKTVAASLLRLRGFKVKARDQEDASPVFENTPARGGGQKITFKTSQEAMLKAYERVNEDSTDKAIKHINRIVYGNDGRDGSQPTLPYPDGTFISTWNGGHCTGAVLYKGKLFCINPFYDARYSETSVETVVSSMCNVSGPTYKYDMLNAVGRYRRDKSYARARGQRYQLDPNSVDKTMVLHFLGKQKEMRRTNRNVTDEQVADACSRDELWRNINGSFVIRPDEPLIPALFGLAKPSTT